VLKTRELSAVIQLLIIMWLWFEVVEYGDELMMNNDVN
jgi:hypothetical protein